MMFDVMQIGIDLYNKMMFLINEVNIFQNKESTESTESEERVEYEDIWSDILDIFGD